MMMMQYVWRAALVLAAPAWAAHLAAATLDAARHESPAHALARGAPAEYWLDHPRRLRAAAGQCEAAADLPARPRGCGEVSIAEFLQKS